MVPPEFLRHRMQAYTFVISIQGERAIRHAFTEV